MADDPIPGAEQIAEFATLRAANEHRQRLWDSGNQITLAYRGNELAGETGEACNIIKKLERERLGIRGSRASKAQLAEELADVVICADLIAMSEGIDLDAAVVAKFNSTSIKVGLPTRLSLADQRAATARREALEQAAKVAEGAAGEEAPNPQFTKGIAHDRAARDIAKRIRALIPGQPSVTKDMKAPTMYVEALHKVRCRFGCDDGVVGIFHAPKGCICWDDPIQALCMQHFITAESTGPIECLVDFRVPNVVE